MYSGVSPIFFQQLETSKDKDYIPVVIMCLGNLCGEDKCRNILVNDRLISIILSLLNRVFSLHFLRHFLVHAKSGNYGELFILLEKRNEKRELHVKTTDEISYKQALIIGAFQVLSLIPGTSRSGATIIGALLIGVSRPAGAEFTFFLAIPVMFGASALKLLKFFLESGGFSGAEWGYLLIGCAVAFAVSLFAIKFLMDFVKKHDFKVFGWYRIALGVIVIATLVVPSFFS